MNGASFPWLDEAWRAILERRRSGRLPHGWLFTGPTGTGKLDFARAFCQAIQCESPQAQGVACGQCHGCRMWLAGAHPDLMELTIPEGKTRILVDQIRELRDFMSLSRSHGPCRMAILWPADTMTENAANSLLKTLEEPPGDAILILVSAHASRLPATVRSRCQQVKLALPSRPEARRWLTEAMPTVPAGDLDALLALGHGSPLRARMLAEQETLSQWRTQLDALLTLLQGRKGVVELSEQWHKLPVDVLVDRLQILMADGIRRHMTGGDGSLLSGMATSKDLQVLTGQLDLAACFRFQERLLEWRRLSDTPINPQVLLEDILVTLLDLAQT
ncbi:DNA polymerase III subunit delta' [Ectothiorhodospira lacustris]|uniref:DNA polymerase III subunit delta' n=1 Tax=Ectothiorhodospira lacustris TaxID=2899127 RepID=UPI001EE78989|nr:DNA polymerase III subunit delta' [Ectothiorhodospira lacustris]MCG5500518.1 DNA polymerase III subunit delta' [Ectothiorhodospira lacustris]MCG5510168.1 DNA polymerase III subunit delta' [Ectothiorhodospira lacustris]MCG5522011.1 DNA polymerase III subunit delta' [Ectothiorhodospira lacustris]